VTAAGRYRASLYALLAPYLLGVAVLVAIPVALTVGPSFTAYDGLSAPTWRGLGNFREVLVVREGRVTRRFRTGRGRGGVG